jgi:GAF domain-containing protein
MSNKKSSQRVTNRHSSSPSAAAAANSNNNSAVGSFSVTNSPIALSSALSINPIASKAHSTQATPSGSPKAAAASNYAHNRNKIKEVSRPTHLQAPIPLYRPKTMPVHQSREDSSPINSDTEEPNNRRRHHKPHRVDDNHNNARFAADQSPLSPYSDNSPRAEDKYTMDPKQILQVTELMSSNVAADSMIQRILEASTKLIQAEIISIFQYNAEENVLVCKVSKVNVNLPPQQFLEHKDPNSASAQHNSALSSLVGAEISTETGLAGFSLKTSRSIRLFGNYSRDWRYNSEADYRLGLTHDSILIVPIRSEDGRVVAIIEAVNSLRKSKKFSQNDEILLSSMGCTASCIFRKVSQDTEVAKEKAENHALHSIAALTAAELSVKPVLNKIVQATRSIIHAQLIRLYNVDEQNKHLVLYNCAQLLSADYKSPGTTQERIIPVVHNESSDLLAPAVPEPTLPLLVHPEPDEESVLHVIPFGQGIAGSVCMTGIITKVNNFPDFRFDLNREEHCGLKVSSILVVPIKDYTGRTIAVLELVNKINSQPNSSRNHLDSPPFPAVLPFTATDERLLQSLASCAANVLRQSLLHEENQFRKRQSEALQQLNELLSADIGTSHVVPRIIEAAYRLVSAERISLFNIEDGTEAKGPEESNSPSHLSAVSPSLSRFPSENSTFLPETKETEAKPGLAKPSSLNHLAKPTVGATRHRSKQFDSKVIVCCISKDPSMIGRRIRMGQGLVGTVALTLRSIKIDDAYADTRFDTTADKSTNFITRSILTVPIIDDLGKGVAVIQAINKLTPATNTYFNRFNQEDLQILENLSLIAGIVLRKTKMLHTTENAEKKAQALLSLVSIDMEDSLSNIISAIVDVCYEAFLNPDKVTLYFIDDRKKELFSIVSKDTKGARIQLGVGIAGSCAAAAQVINVRDCYEDARFDRSFDERTGYTTRSCLCAPVKDEGGRVLAVIQLLNKKSISVAKGSSVNMALSMKLDERRNSSVQEYTHFTAEDQELLAALCAQLRTIIRKCRTEALLDRLGTQHDAAVGSLLDLYTERNSGNRFASGRATPLSAYTPGAHRARSVSNSDRSFSTTHFSWPKYALSSSKYLLLHSTEFDVFSYSDDELCSFAMTIIAEETGLLGLLNIPIGKLQSLILAIRKKYCHHPFHNFKHAFSVLHFSYLILRHNKANSHADILDSLDVLALLISALAHDVAHTGRTNQFEINSSSLLALTHNDQSVLENHHCSTFFTILRAESCNIFANFDTAQQREVRRIIISAIQSTDMAFHGEQSQRLSEIESLKNLSANNAADKQFLINTYLHTADLSGQVFPLTVAKQWESRIAAEFNNQYQEELRRNLPLSNFMQGLHNIVTRAKLQMAFIDLLLPYWGEIARLFGPEFNKYYEALFSNRLYFERLAEGKEKNYLALFQGNSSQQQLEPQLSPNSNDSSELLDAASSFSIAERSPSRINNSHHSLNSPAPSLASSQSKSSGSP